MSVGGLVSWFAAFLIHRKNHQRALDSMQASLEAEARGKADAMRVKKKLEADINELEVKQRPTLQSRL